MNETLRIKSENENERDVNREFIENLKNILNENLPKLKGAINLLMEGEHTHYQTPENVLWGHVCGRAVRVLGYLLRQKGYDAAQYETHDLGDQYSTPDHAILIMTNSNGKKIIIDPAYLQFADIFWLEKKYMPKEEILVVPTDDIDQVVKSLVELRDIKIGQHPNPDILQNASCIFRMTKEELTKHFSKVWDIKQYSLMEKMIEDDIEKFKLDPDSVSLPTKKLIEYLDQ